MHDNHTVAPAKVLACGLRWTIKTSFLSLISTRLAEGRGVGGTVALFGVLVDILCVLNRFLVIETEQNKGSRL